MLIIKLLVNEKILNAEFALNQASSETVIEVCKKYITLLTEYQDDLNKFAGNQEIKLNPSSALLSELVEQTRKVIQTEEDNTIQKRNQTEALLQSFTSISDYEAVQTFNQLEYKGFKDWELRANEVRLKTDTNNEKFTVQEAITIASELRRKAFVIFKTKFIKT